MATLQYILKPGTVFSAGFFRASIGNNMSSQSFIAICLWLLLIVCVCAGCERSEVVERNTASSPDKSQSPDVILISIDTLRADHLGCYGKQSASTPNLDSLAASGVLFETACTTVPVTLPAHCSILSGLVPPEHGVRTNGSDFLEESVVTVTEVLKKNGYQTGAFVASEPLKSDRGLMQGFDVYDDQFGGQNVGKSRFEQQTERFANEVAAAATGWIGTQKRSQPLFAFVHFFDPHWPYVKPMAGAEKPGYSGEIAYVDRVLGKMLESIRRDREESNLIVVVTSDHGEGLGEHNEKSHCIFVYDSTLRVPLIIYAPERVTPKRVVNPVSVIDVAPTILELAGIQGLDDCDGISLVDAMKSGAAEIRDIYFESYYGQIRFGWAPLNGIRRGNLKYIHAPRAEMYDLQKDPGELDNVVATHQPLVADFKNVLDLVGEGKRSAGILDDEAIRKLANLGYVSAKPAGNVDKAKRADPKDRIEVYDQFQSAYQMYSDGAIDETLNLMAGLEKHMSDSPHFYFEWAFFQSEADDWQGAAVSYAKCLELDSENTKARLNLGAAHLKTKNFAEAQKSLDYVLAVEPENANARLYAGFAAKELGNNQLAIEHWKHFVRLAPNHPDAAKIRAVVASGN